MAVGTTASSPDRAAHPSIRARGSNRAAVSDMQDRILETAAQLYRRIGHGKTTVADIAHDMSMSPANVYRFFPTKHAIESAVAGKLLDQLLLAAREAASADLSAAARLRAVLQAVGQLHAARSIHTPRLHALLVTATRENWPGVDSCADRLNSILAQLVAEGQSCGEFRDGDTMMLANCALGAAAVYLDPSLIGAGASSSRPTFDQMIDFCIGALRK